MVITRSQAGSRQPLDPAASPRANPPRRAQSQTSSILNNLLRKEMSVVVQGQLEVVLLHHWLRGMSPMDLVVADPTA